MILSSLFVSTGVVALAEMGDKTQLLAFLLAARFRRPWPIIWGIFVATLANHSLAGALGTWLMSVVSAEVLRWVLGLSFLAMALWTLIPDDLDPDGSGAGHRYGVFGTTLVAFFLAEMGDKTQLATVALAARYAEPVSVILGTTLGMMIANVPAVFIGDRLADRLPLRGLRVAAAVAFALLGFATLLGWGARFGI